MVDEIQVIGGDRKKHLTVDGVGNVHLGSRDEPKEIIMHDTVAGSAYSLAVTNGNLILTKT